LKITYNLQSSPASSFCQKVFLLTESKMCDKLPEIYKRGDPIDDIGINYSACFAQQSKISILLLSIQYRAIE